MSEKRNTNFLVFYRESNSRMGMSNLYIYCTFFTLLFDFIILGIFQSEKAKMRKATSLSNKSNNEVAVADFGRDFADSPFDEENDLQGMFKFYNI